MGAGLGFGMPSLVGAGGRGGAELAVCFAGVGVGQCVGYGFGCGSDDSVALAGSVQFEGEFIRYPLSLSVGLARQIWVGGVGLFPGTLVVAVESDAVVIHVLDKNMSVLAGLLTFERYLVRLLADVREEV